MEEALTDLVGAENRNLTGSINVRLTPCLFCLDSAALLMMKLNSFAFLDKSKPVNQDVIIAVMLPLSNVSVLWLGILLTKCFFLQEPHLIKVVARISDWVHI